MKEQINIKDSNPTEDWGFIKTNEFQLNPTPDKRVFVLDNVFKDPHKVRDYALNQYFFDDDGYLGLRTRKQHFYDGLKELFEEVIGKNISKWEGYSMNARFQSHKAGISPVYHADSQRWAAAIYLTPNAPFEAGTSFYAYTKTGARHGSDKRTLFEGNTFVDPTPYSEVDRVGNVFNRLVIWDANLVHAAPVYFGHDINTSRLTQVFFFDTKE